jgi:hypothetical protein
MAETKTNVKVEHLSKKGKQEKFELKDEDGNVIKEYTLQFPGIRKTEELFDEARNAVGILEQKKYNELLMKHVIVEPKTDWDYWDENEGYRRVMDAADTFLGELLH